MNINKPVSFLIVEDDEDDLLILKDCLADSFKSFELHWARNYSEFIACLEGKPFDIVITDYLLGSTSGLEVLKASKEAWTDVPVILLTGKGNQSLDLEAMKMGADDYLVKGNFDAAILERSIRYALERSKTALIQRENEEYQNRLNKIVSAGRIARMIAHEVRGPLTNILLSVDQIRHKTGENTDTKFYLDIISNSTEKINQLVSELIDSTKFGEMRMERANLVDVIGETLSMAEDRAKLKSATLAGNYSHPVIEMELDREKLKIALLNIVINGLEAVDEGKGEILVDVARSSHAVLISVRDNGCGMSEETRESIFEPFFTNKTKGSGIGLTSTQNIVLGHKGRIDVESAIGKGSCFKIYFPLPE
ncbi:MAG TPA: ATP-binding protein [Bacteroidia bacterium]|nr:ATP-binding protein [Bacteroidia bacterium]